MRYRPVGTSRFAVALSVALGVATPAAAFTVDQAAAGRAAFEQSCASCHGATLRQLPSAILAGPEFVAKWGDRTTADLLAQMSATMPPDRPGALTQGEYLGMIAYVLQANGGAADAQPLAAATAARIGTGLNPQVALAAVAAGSAGAAPAAASAKPPEPTG